ncbi:unnamed protein product [Chrysodeixis includens]|uniref:Uncharacterized protein n=1 Tax=Chrysodeixis includens TaxID=689277 RepID=A0A9P0BQU1_CHRIL|nr:unnamed protein product [Chrysodeixis includens]
MFLAQPASKKFKGSMNNAFQRLTDLMSSKGSENLVRLGKFSQNYRDAALELKRTPDLRATEFDTKLAKEINLKLQNLTKAYTPLHMKGAMADMIDICSNYLAQHAEYNKDKSPAFRQLLKTLRSKPNETLYEHGKATRTYAQAAAELETAKGLEADHDDPNLSRAIHSELTALVPPAEMGQDMLDERGPAFDLLLKELRKEGAEPFSDFPPIATKHAAAYTLESAPGLTTVSPDNSTSPQLKAALHKAVDAATPKDMQSDMKEVIDRCGDYLSAFVRDRDAALGLLLDMMKTKPNNVFAKRNDYTITYGVGAKEIEKAPSLVPYLPIKDIADEGKKALTRDMAGLTPQKLQKAMKAAIQDVSRYLSQLEAIRSGVGGPRYPMNFLAAVKKALGARPLFKYKVYGQTFDEAADTLLHAGPVDSNLSTRANLASLENLPTEEDLASPQEIEKLQKLAAQGSQEAKEELAAQENLAKLENLANQGNAAAMKELEKQQKVTAEKKLQTLQKLAVKGDREAQSKLAAQENLVKLHQLAENGDPQAQEMLKSRKEQVKLEKLAAQGDPEAKKELAKLETAAEEKHLDNLQKRAAQGDKVAEEMIGEQKKLVEMQKLAEKGDSKAQMTVAEHKERVKLEKLAEQGDPEANKSLAKQEAAEAEKKLHDLKKLAAKGDEEAREKLQEQKEILKLQKLAATGDRDAQDKLATQRKEAKEKMASPVQAEQSVVNLQHEIASEMKRGVPTRLAPTIADGLEPTMNKAAKHLAKVGTKKGKALEHLVDLMKEKGETPLGELQGYEQTYSDGARRIEDAPSLANDKVDKGAYASVKGKLTAVAAAKPPAAEIAQHLPGMVDESSKFLSAPVPETDAEKRKVLADLMGRKGNEILGEEGIYKMTYKEGGKEIMKAPVGLTKAYDEQKKKALEKNIHSVIPDNKMMELLKETAKEGAAHLANVIKGRGEAMGVIHKDLRNKKDKEFIDVGDFKKTHEQAADMLANAPYFGGEKASPVLLDKVTHQVDQLPKNTAGNKMAKEHMKDASQIASRYIAGAATNESGLDAQALSALDAPGLNAQTEEARRLAASNSYPEGAGVVSGAGAGAVAGPAGVGLAGVGPGGVGPGGVGPGGVGPGGVWPGGAGPGGVGPGGVGAGGVGPGGVGSAAVGPAGVGAGGVGAGGVGPGGVGPGGVGPGGVGPAGVGAGGVGPGGVGPGVAGPGGVGPGGVGPGGVGPAGVGPAGVGPAAVGPAGVGASGVGPGGVGPAGVGAGGVGPGGVGPGVVGPAGVGAGGVGPGGFKPGGVGPGGVEPGGVWPGGVGPGGVGPGGVGPGSVGPGGVGPGSVGPGGVGPGGVGPGGVGPGGVGPGGVGPGGVWPGGAGLGGVGPGGVGPGGVGPTGVGPGGVGPAGVGAGGVGPAGVGTGGVGPGGVGPAGVGAGGVGPAGVGAGGVGPGGVWPGGAGPGGVGPTGVGAGGVGPGGVGPAVVGAGGVGPDGVGAGGVGPGGVGPGGVWPGGAGPGGVGPTGVGAGGVGPGGVGPAVVGAGGVGPDGVGAGGVGPGGVGPGGVWPGGAGPGGVGPTGVGAGGVGPGGVGPAVVGAGGVGPGGVGPGGVGPGGVGPGGVGPGGVGPAGVGAGGVGPGGVGPGGVGPGVVGPGGVGPGGVGPAGVGSGGVGPAGVGAGSVGPAGVGAGGVGPGNVGPGGVGPGGVGPGGVGPAGVGAGGIGPGVVGPGGVGPGGVGPGSVGPGGVGRGSVWPDGAGPGGVGPGGVGPGGVGPGGVGPASLGAGGVGPTGVGAGSVWPGGVGAVAVGPGSVGADGVGVGGVGPAVVGPAVVGAGGVGPDGVGPGGVGPGGVGGGGVWPGGVGAGGVGAGGVWPGGVGAVAAGPGSVGADGVGVGGVGPGEVGPGGVGPGGIGPTGVGPGSVGPGGVGPAGVGAGGVEPGGVGAGGVGAGGVGPAGVGAGGVGPGGVGPGGVWPGAVGAVAAGSGSIGADGVGVGGVGPGGIGPTGVGPSGVGPGGVGPAGVGAGGVGPGGVGPGGVDAGAVGPGGVGPGVVGPGVVGPVSMGRGGIEPGGVETAGVGTTGFGTGDVGLGGVLTSSVEAGTLGPGGFGPGSVGPGSVGPGGVGPGGVGPGGVGPGGVDAGAVGPGGVGPGVVGPGVVGPGVVGPVSMGPGVIGPGGVAASAIRPGGIGPGDVGLSGFGPGSVGSGGVGPGGVRTGGVVTFGGEPGSVEPGGVGPGGVGPGGVGPGGVGPSGVGPDGVGPGGISTGAGLDSGVFGESGGGAAPGADAGVGTTGGGFEGADAGVGPEGAGGILESVGVDGPGGAGGPRGGDGDDSVGGLGGAGRAGGYRRTGVVAKGVGGPGVTSVGTGNWPWRERSREGVPYGIENDQQRRRRLAEEEAHRRFEEGERRRLGDEEYYRRLAEQQRLELEAARGGYGRALGAEHELALQILHKELRARGNEILYQQPHTTLTHAQASDWIAMDQPFRIDKSVKESTDTARLQKKFERKLDAVVAKATPPDLTDSMQDFKALVREALISEMQKRGNQILAEIDGAAESYFFAAQRLKKVRTYEPYAPWYQESHLIAKKLEDMIRSRSMARKLTASMKEHVKEAADYLSRLVTKPDDKIEAYIALLEEMEAAGDFLLIEGDIPKTFKEAAAYLRQLTSFEDQICRPNETLHAITQNRLQNLMSQVPPSGYSQEDMDGEKTEALKVIVEAMDEAGDRVLLRHGSVHKSYKEGADLLRRKNTDQLSAPHADPVAARKIQIKLTNLMQNKLSEQYHPLIDEVIKVCKCMKNVFVQCELWCDEILRRVGRPCSTCARHVSAQMLQDLDSAPGSSRITAPGLRISISTCPTRQNKSFRHHSQLKCPASHPTPDCQRRQTASYLMYGSSYDQLFGNRNKPSSSSESGYLASRTRVEQSNPRSSTAQSLLNDIHSDNMKYLEGQGISLEHIKSKIPEKSSLPYLTPESTMFTCQSQDGHSSLSFMNFPTPMFSNTQIPPRPHKLTQAKSGYSSRTPIISTDQMADWHAMMVSLMWNVQAWRDWIQENINRALALQHNTCNSGDQIGDNWATFQRRVSTEALQWRQYSMFSRQLTTRLALKYKDKEIVSPMTTKKYWECQEDMLAIMDLFNTWTQWLMLVVKETDSLHQESDSDLPLYELRWNHLKKKVEEYSKDWMKYNMHLKVAWEQKYNSIIADYLPTWSQPGPVWVVSACGAVPSGAVAAGIHDGEVIWVARTTHKCNVLPAALYPSKHCCLVYSEGAVMCNAEVEWMAWRGGSISERAVRVAAGVHVGRVHYHGDYLLGAVHEPHYRCHVVIFGRPFAFNCYELLMLTEPNVN